MKNKTKLRFKLYIEELSLRNIDYKYPEQAINQAESLKFSFKRFTHELIQNAVDAQAKYALLAIIINK